jgi:alpha-amylase
VPSGGPTPIPGTNVGAGTGSIGGVLLEGFYMNCPSSSGAWWWDHLQAQATTWARAGFTAVWIPCALKGASGGVSTGYDPFDDYDLGSKDQRGTIPTHYGTRQGLERLCAVLHANGLQVYEDIVDTHRDGDPGNFSYRYVDALGNPGGGRFPKSAGYFFSQRAHGHDDPRPGRHARRPVDHADDGPPLDDGPGRDVVLFRLRYETVR